MGPPIPAALLRTYRGLLRASLPEGLPARPRLVWRGYLNAVFEVDSRYIFRFPRSLRAARQIALELRLLPLLSKRVRLPVPDPSIVGSLPGRAGWPFMGYLRIEGEGLDWDHLGPRRRAVLREELAPVLADLARFPWREARRLGVPGGDGRAWRLEMRQLHRSLQRWAFPLMDHGLRREVDGRFRAYLEDPRNFRFRPCLLHGEVHSLHVLWRRGHLSGLIDWGFAGVGDPARELLPWVSHFGTKDVDPLTEGRVAAGDHTFQARLELYRLFVPLWWIRNLASAGKTSKARQELVRLRRALSRPPEEGWTV